MENQKFSASISPHNFSSAISYEKGIIAAIVANAASFTSISSPSSLQPQNLCAGINTKKIIPSEKKEDPGTGQSLRRLLQTDFSQQEQQYSGAMPANFFKPPDGIKIKNSQKVNKTISSLILFHLFLGLFQEEQPSSIFRSLQRHEKLRKFDWFYSVYQQCYTAVGLLLAHHCAQFGTTHHFILPLTIFLFKIFSAADQK